jgi:VanZ family protein
LFAGKVPTTGRILLFRIALVLALLSLGYLATSPTQVVLPETNDKLKHLAAFLLLAQLSDAAFPRRPWNWRKFIPLLGYGLLLECIQYFVPNRFFSLADLLADAVGLGLYPLVRIALDKVWASFRSQP